MRENMLHSATMHYIAAKFSEEVRAIETKDSQLSFPTVAWLMRADCLKVGVEDHVLQYLFHYTRDKPATVVDFLAPSIRFCYLEMYAILSAVRKRTAIRDSKVFSDMLRAEINARLSKDTNLERPRLFYDCSEGQGRLQQQAEDPSHAIIGEMLNWAFKSAPDVESKRRDRRADHSRDAAREIEREYPVN